MNMESAAQPQTSEATVGLTDGKIRDTLEETTFIERSSLLEDKVSYRGSRLLTSVASVSEFYSSPKKLQKPSGKLAQMPFEQFDMALYRSKACFNGFQTSQSRLPLWIFTCYKIAYDDLGISDDFFVDWNDKVDDDDQFDHIMCKFYDGTDPDEQKLKVILRIYLKTSCLTLQGGEYLWFINDIFPKVRAIFETLLTESNQSASKTPPQVSVTKRTLAVSSKPDSKEKHFTSQIPLPVYPISPRKLFNHTTSSVLPQVDCIQIANIESKMVEVLQIIEKFDVNNVLKNMEKIQKETVKRLDKIESKLASSKEISKDARLDISPLITKLDLLQSTLASVNIQNLAPQDLTYKDNQIDLLISEITSKNKEIEKLRKSNAVLVQKQKDHDNIINYEKELKDCISVLDVKKQEITKLEEIKHELEIENTKLQRKLDDCFYLEKEILATKKDLESANLICSRMENDIEKLDSKNKDLKSKLQEMCSIEKELSVAKRNLEMFEKDYDRQSAIIDDKNKIIHNLLKSSNNQIT